MEHAIPLTNFGAYVAEAKAIQQSLKAGAASAETVRDAVVRLTDLTVRALDENHQVLEGLALLIRALHPEVTRKARQQPS